MRGIRHKLRDKDFESRTCVCSICGPIEMAVMGRVHPIGMCRNSYDESRAKSRGKQHGYWWPAKEESCEACMFVPEDPCQLTQSVLGKHASSSNVWTLCFNCDVLRMYQPPLFYASIGSDLPTASGRVRLAAR